MSRKLVFGIVAALSAMVLLISGCSQGTSGAIVISGSTALQPLVQEAAEKFMAKYPKAQITVNGGGSGTGLSQVSQGQVNIGNSDIFAEEKSGIDASALVDHRVCVVGFAVVVNREVAVDSLTSQQIADIFTGKITNWKDIGGDDIAIAVVNRPKSSGTRAVFKKYVMNGVEEAESSMTEDSSGQIRKIVSETPGAISYLALSYVDDSLKALKLDGVEPSKEKIVSGDYPFWSYEHMYTRGQPTGLTKSFLDYMMSDDVQQNIVPSRGYISITEMKVTRNP